MEIEEKKLTFFITHEGREGIIELFEFDTVEILKIQIHNHFHIPPHKQTIKGWSINPECDFTVLSACAKLNSINCLEVQDHRQISILSVQDHEGGSPSNMDFTSNVESQDLEVEATNSFVQKISNNYNVHSSIRFHTCSLMSAIAKACLVPLEERKVLLLYLHKPDDRFSSQFMDNLRKPQVIDTLKTNFFLLGWDIEETKYQDALLRALRECDDLSYITEILKCNVPAALCIVPIIDSVTILSCLKENVSDKDFLTTLSNAEKFLIIENQEEKDLEEVEREADLEVEATNSFVQKISKNYNVHSSIRFHTCSLMSAIAEACLVPLEERKVLLLYLHKPDDKFSSQFMDNLRKPQVIDTLKTNFFLLGWDIEETKYQDALLRALRECGDLSYITEIFKCNVPAVLCIVPIKDSVTILSCLKENVSDKDFLTLSNAEKFLIIENQEEKDLEELEREAGNENDMDSFKYQQLMVDMLGDRDYDGFEFNQHDLLKKKIAFALFGQPRTEIGDGYDSNDMKKVQHLFKTILTNSNQIAQYKDRVEISFIYNCTEPLPSEKLRRSKQFMDYNPKTDLMPVPIFVLRKCHGSRNPCRLFIDHIGRIYQTWDDYKNRNKLHECEMVLPKNGRYEVDEYGKVLLEVHLSPACGIDVRLLQTADRATMAGGFISAGIFTATLLPGITVAPALVVGGAVVGAGVGLYSIARSAFTLYDRSRHRETLSFANSEARGAYINILAGALGFAGAGANMAVSQMASRGVNIGTGARAAVDALSVVNVTASGVAVINSGYDVIDKWFNENQTPSLLTMVQLTSSILFFGNAVYNFRSCSTIIEETQMRTLQSYQESLRSNRHRKTFTKLMKETIRQNNMNEAQGKAEVIAAIRNIQNKDEVFAVLTRTSKDMNKKGIKISAVGGEIVLNGVQVDFNEFASMNKKEVTSFLSKLSRAEPMSIETASRTRFMVSDVLQGFSITDIDSVANIAMKLLGFCDGDIQTKVISALASLLASLTDPIRKILEEMFPNQSKYVHLMEVVINFFAQTAENLELDYRKWVSTGDNDYYNPLFRYIDVQQTKRVVGFFKEAVNMYYMGMHLTEEALKRLLKYFHNWLAKKFYERQQDSERLEKRKSHSALSPSNKVSCPVCGGYYYRPRN